MKRNQESRNLLYRRKNLWAIETRNKHGEWQLLATVGAIAAFSSKDWATNYMRAMPFYRNFPAKCRLRKYTAEQSAGKG